MLAAGGFESNLEWLREVWGSTSAAWPADNFIIRGTPLQRWPRPAEAAARRRRRHRSAIPRSATRSPSMRARRSSTAASCTRLDCVSLGIVVNTRRRSASTTKARTSGRSATRSGAGWSRSSPTRSPTRSSMRRSVGRFMPSVFPPIARRLDPELARDARADRRQRWTRPSDDSTPRSRRARSTTRCSTTAAPTGLDAAEDALGAAPRHAAVSRLSAAARHHLHLSRRRR